MKKLLFIISIIGVFSAWSQDTPPENWFTLDPAEDKTQGVSADKVHKMLEGKESRTVIVAVIDSGVDIEHEDLKNKIWTNDKEIAGNGIDDDKNGYVDDVNGWNFIGGKDGQNVDADTYEVTREYVRLKPIYDGVEKVSKRKREEFEYWKVVKAEYEESIENATKQYDFYSNLKNNTLRYYNLLLAYLDTDSLTFDQVKSIESTDGVIRKAKETATLIYSNVGEDADFGEVADQLTGAVDHFGDQVKYAFNTEFEPRTIVGDNWDDPYEKGYGNNDVEGPDASHGTHVAGIIAAERNNDVGIRGIAENVLIMPIRAVPNGDERDKDVANAIRYAVDNGAHIINMSFGKSFTYRKKVVDEAIKYAMDKGVLCVHAAGNSSENLDVNSNYPTPKLDNGKRASNWIEVGASSWGDNDNFVGSFSNYGKENVDLFAPGVQVYSTIPDNGYDSFNGTSMASPATSGVAAVIMSYFPELDASQVRQILNESTRKFDGLMVKKPGSEELVDFSELSITGGLINTEEAVKMAEQMTEDMASK